MRPRDGDGERTVAGVLDLHCGELVVLEENEVAGVESKEAGSELSGVDGSGELVGDEGQAGLKVVVIGVVGSCSCSVLNAGCFGVVGEWRTVSKPPMEASSSSYGEVVMVRAKYLGVENECW